MLYSDKTFAEESDSFRDIERIFWEAERLYPSDPFSGILEEFRNEDRLEPQYGDSIAAEPAGARDTRNIRPLRRTNLSILQRREVINSIGRASGKSHAEFKESFWDLLGIDIDGELSRFSRSEHLSNEGALQALTAKFGVEAFGTYCPWHAFGNSNDTPWGIYMFFDKLLEWACALHRSERFLPNPKPPLSQVFQLLWYVTYRHELFHFHVELYATRMESALRSPVYRPYVERVRARVANTSEWWEEALAQAVVLRSTLVKRTLKVDSEYMKMYVVPYFRTFPEGYRQFECESVGGPEVAHRILSAQVARAQREVPETDRSTGLSLAKNEHQQRTNIGPVATLYLVIWSCDPSI